MGGLAIDTDSACKAVNANQGASIAEVANILGVSDTVARGKLRKAKEMGHVICLGHGKNSGWYTMEYYLSNKEMLEERHKPKHPPKPAGARKISIFDDWCQRILHFDQLMRRPGL